MNLASFVWGQLRKAGRLPLAYWAFYGLANFIFADGCTITLRRGPAAGFKSRHYPCYQPWMVLGLYEPEAAQLIFSLLKPGDIFYDVGANAGYFTLIAARAVGSTGKVVAFDLLPKNVATIREQIVINKLEHVCNVEAMAISGKDETAAFVIPKRAANAHLADVPAPHVVQQSGEIIRVQCIQLDS